MNFIDTDTRLDNTDFYELLALAQDLIKESPGPSPRETLKVSSDKAISWRVYRSLLKG